jgi:DNA gyrase subunit B
VPGISEIALEELAREYLLAEAVINRLAYLIDSDVLHALINANLEVDLSSQGAAEVCARAFMAAIGDKADIQVFARFDEAKECWQLRMERMHHGNVRIFAIDEDFADSGDYAQLRKTAITLSSLFGPGAYVSRGEKKQPVSSFGEAMTWLLNEVEKGISKQRYKGLGEMNPEQLWETTMDPKVRRLLRVQIEDAISADEVLTTLMGELVEPRRNFIETNALAARNIDV